jgi:hypothetical protein
LKYLLLIHAATAGDPDPEMLNRHRAFAQEAARTGKLVDGAELTEPAIATTIRFREGELVVTDGPHAETKEHIAGYYLVDCQDLDEAMSLASTVPFPAGGCVEIRPLVEQ